jgi:hypothetical protein
MKLVCHCGAEISLDYPPVFLAVTRFVLEHGGGDCLPETLRAVCPCGAEREIGPGLAPQPRKIGDLQSQGMSDGQWLEKHAGCLPPRGEREAA